MLFKLATGRLTGELTQQTVTAHDTELISTLPLPISVSCSAEWVSATSVPHSTQT